MNPTTEIVSLLAVAQGQLGAARASVAGRAAHTVYNTQDGVLRQTVLALVAGNTLGEHESPGDATLQVLQGRVRLSAGPASWEMETGDHLSIPASRHDLAAIEDSVVLLTVAPVGGR